MSVFKYNSFKFTTECISINKKKSEVVFKYEGNNYFKLEQTAHVSVRNISYCILNFTSVTGKTFFSQSSNYDYRYKKQKYNVNNNLTT